MLAEIFNLISSFLNYAIMIWFLDGCFDNKNHSYWKYSIAIFGALLSYLAIQINFILLSYISAVFAPIIVGIVYARIFEKGSFRSKLTHIILYFILNYGINVINMYFVMMVHSNLQFIGDNIIDISAILNLISKFVLMVVTFGLVKMEKSYGEFSFQAKDRALVLPFVSFIFLLIFVYMIQVNPSIVYIHFALLFVFLIIVNILVFINSMKLFEYQRLFVTEKLNREMIENEARVQELLEESYEKNRKLRHDLKNHFSVLKGYLYDNQFEQAKAYMDQTYDVMDKTVLYHFQNNAINYILNSKVMDHPEIDFKVRISHSLEFMNNFNITILLGNLLDNAIEAEAGVEEKQIIVDIYEEYGIVYLFVKNTIDRSVLITNQELKTSKSDKENHGIGINNVKMVVQQYDGEISYYEEGNLFIVKVTFFDK